MLLLSAHHAVTVLASVVNPGQGTAPPGSDKVTTVISWAAWIATACCVAGFLFAGASMVFSGGSHAAGQHGTRLGWVMGGCVVIGAASALVAALV